MDIFQQRLLKSALKSLKENGTRGLSRRTLAQLMEIYLDTMLTSAQVNWTVEHMLEKRYARSWFDRITNEERFCATDYGNDTESTLLPSVAG